MKNSILFVLFLFLTHSAFATDYYLSNDGNDSNNGTSVATPWKTLQKLGSELGGSSGTWGIFQNGDRIFFRKGDTFRGSIAFSAYNNSGITFDSYGTGAMPIIKGSQLITSWTVHSGNIWKATVSQTVHFLYVNSLKQTLARTPNTGTWNISSSTSTSITSNNIGSSGKNFVGSNLCLREFDWRLNRQVVTAQSGNVVNWVNGINAAGTNANFYFDNKLEHLDAMGEWFYDTPTQTLYLMSNTNPNNLSVEASVNLRGIAGNDNRTDNIFKNLQFEHYADSGIFLNGASNNNQIINCKFINNCNSFYLSGRFATITNNIIQNVSVQGMILANMQNSNIKFNTISNIGLEFGNHRPNFVGDFYSSGIWLIQANDGGTVIAENSIINCGYNGIRYGGNNILIEKNVIENTLLNMDDGGAIYTYGNDSFSNTIRNNFIKNVVGDHNGTAPGGIANGIYMDNYAHSTLIQNNTIEDIAVGSAILVNAGSYGNTIQGNVTYKCREGLSFADWQGGQSIYNNTLLNNTLYANAPGGIPILIASDDNNYTVMSNSNNNYLCNPYSSNVVKYIWSNSATFTLPQWRVLNAANNFDTTSTASFYNLTFPIDNSFIVTNRTATLVNLNFTNTLDLNNNPITSVALPAFSSRVLVSQMAASPVPLASASQNVCPGATVTDLSGTGTNLKWYAAATGGAPLAGITPLVNGSTYHLSQTASGLAESSRVAVLVNVGATTTWTGTWSNGLPSFGVGAIINANYSGGGFSACSLQVTGNAIVTIPSGQSLNIDGLITVASTASLTMANNSAIIQNREVKNIGIISVLRNTSPLMLLDYSMWSSPVANQNLLAFSPGTLTNRFYTYNTATNLFTTIAPNTNRFELGQGYLIRLPNTHPTTPTIWTGTFTGVPNNGTINISLNSNGAGQRYNMIGNPYPSPISMTSFVAANTGAITGSIWFWRKTNSTTNTNRWNTWNNGIFVPAPSEANIINPNGIIRTGQGFIVEAAASPLTLYFHNNMRVANFENQFFRTSHFTTENVLQKSTLWLQANSSSGEFCQLAVSYTDGGTNAVDKFDAKNLSDSPITFTSKVDGTADLFTIQGRPAPFVNTDVVPLHFKSTIADTFSISVTDKEGIFANGNQAVYIHDKLTNTLHDITINPFTFTSSAAGTFADRFDLKFNQTILGMPSFDKNESLNVYVKDNNININQSNLSQIKEVRLYDMKGALLFEKKGIFADSYSIEFEGAEQLLIVKVVLADDRIINKKIVK